MTQAHVAVVARSNRAPAFAHCGGSADLEAICLHCLQKNPGAGYPSTRALADDLGRFLEGRAVSVRKLNVFQRTTHWARRRTEVAIAAGFAVAVLAVGLATSLWLWRRAKRAHRKRQISRFLNGTCSPPPTPVWNPDRTRPMSAFRHCWRMPRQNSIATSTCNPQRVQGWTGHRPRYFGLGLWHQAYARLVRPMPMHAATCLRMRRWC